MQKILVVVLLIATLLISTVAAIELPTVTVPSVATTVSSGSTEASVDLYLPPTPCYECMPEPTPAPVYETIGLTVSVSSTKVRQNSKVTFAATQISGTPVLSTASWDWVIQQPTGRGFSAQGQTVTTKVPTFGRWHINLNVRDQVQLLNGHLTTDFNIAEKR